MKNELETERLVLQRPEPEDLQDLFRLCTKPEVNLYNPAGADRDIRDSKQTLNGFIADWNNDQIGYYSVRIKSSGEYLGYIGLRKKKFLGKNLLNLAYRIEPKFQRQGYTYEACRYILDNLDSELSQIPIMALTKMENIPSFQLAVKLGLIHNPKFNNYPEQGDIYLFSIDKEISDLWEIPKNNMNG